MRHLRSVWLITIGVAVLAASGCSGDDGSPSSFCVPQLTVEPVHPRAGDTITVSTADKCDADVLAGGWVVIAAPVGDVASAVQTAVLDDLDGTFSVKLTLSADFPLGDAFARIENWDYSSCDGEGSCAAASGTFTVLP